MTVAYTTIFFYDTFGKVYVLHDSTVFLRRGKYYSKPW
jgi:hypothetical protein